MIDPTHPLTPWTHDECVALLRQQIAANTKGRDQKIVGMYLNGYSARDVAEWFGVNTSTVLNIVHRDQPDAIRSRSYRRKGGEAAAD